MQTPSPECENYEQLAEDFAGLLYEKHKEYTCNNLDRFPKYDPLLRQTPRLTQFNELMTEEVQEMINNMQAKM